MYKNITYAHEHTTIDLSGVKKDADCRLDSFDDVVEEFTGLATRGVTTVIDMTNRGMGRNVSYTQRVAGASGLAIVHATGYYKEPFLPEECYTLEEKALAAIMIQEANTGIDGTGIKAKVLGEVGTSKDAITPIEAKLLRATAMAHAETGLPVCTHTTLGTLGMEQLAIFADYGVDLGHTVLSHIDLSGDVEYMLRLLDTGVNIAFDTVGKNNYQPDAGRASWLAELCRRGHAGQVVLSVDITRQSHYAKNGGIGYAHLLDVFVPLLEAEGVPQAEITAMLCNNPQRIYKL